MSNFMSQYRLMWRHLIELSIFGLWKVQVKDVLIQARSHKALNERPSSGTILLKSKAVMVVQESLVEVLAS